MIKILYGTDLNDVLTNMEPAQTTPFCTLAFQHNPVVVCKYCIMKKVNNLNKKIKGKDKAWEQTNEKQKVQWVT